MDYCMLFFREDHYELKPDVAKSWEPSRRSFSEFRAPISWGHSFSIELGDLKREKSFCVSWITVPGCDATLCARKKLHIGAVMVSHLSPPHVLGVFPHHRGGRKSNANILFSFRG